MTATDEDGDNLTYTLEGTNAARFDIDWATGQILTKDDLDREDDSLQNFTYTVMVRATDPSEVPVDTGDTDGSDTVTVIIMVTNVNEAPDVTGIDPGMFTENAEALLLVTYTAPDPENDTPITWSLGGADMSKFEIDVGALEFKDTPNYEMPTDANKDNVYEVTVQASDGKLTGMKKVEVKVTNMNELGMVTLSRTTPRVGFPVTATLTDPDGSISKLTWQWSEDGGNIDDATSATYTPVGDDVDDTLTVTAMYFDGATAADSDMKWSAEVVSTAVAEGIRANKAPEFGDEDPDTDGTQNTMATREVEENTEADAADDSIENDVSADNVDSAVMAVDPAPNADAILTYTLSGTDAAKFRVRDNGQIEVGAGTDLDYETKRTYRVTVTAEDSFGAMSSIEVTIMVTDVDEAPEIMPGGLAIGGSNNIEYAENGTAAVQTYRVVGPDADAATWSLSGDDMGDFMFSGGMLTFRSSPNYENPTDMNMDNAYMVTIMADDGTYMDTHDVMVMVTNVDEPGMVTLSSTSPVVGTELTATLTDVDGMTSAEMWQWARSMDTTTWDDIAGEMGVGYTPMDMDAGYYLRATVNYTDPQGSGKEEEAVTANAMNAANAAPEFPGMTDTRMVGENTAAGMNIGTPVAANDADTLTYTLSGVDAGSFDINEMTGQLMTKDSLDFEMKDSYTVIVTATDPLGTTGTITVTISVTNVDEPGVVTLMPATAPVVGTPVMATLVDPDGGVTDITWQWATVELPGEPLEITGETGETYTPVGGDVGTRLQATATYTDAHGMQTKEHTTDGVVVSRNTAPEFPATETSDRSVAENTAAGDNVGDPVTATDDDRDDTLAYALSGTDAASFDIDMGTGQIMVGAGTMLDFETTISYMVVVTATDGSGANDTQMVTISVTNVDEPGMVTLWAGTVALTMAPEVDDTITGAVMDPDGGVTGETWQWSRTTTPAMMDSWMDIAGETNAAYTVTEGDTGYYLRVMATYTDAVGTATEYSPATMMVTAEAGDTLVDRYDLNNNGIEKTEVLKAINDYLFPEGGEAISKPEVLRLINLYLFPEDNNADN